MAEPLFRRLALIGIGLIGSSVARIAMRARRPRGRGGGERAHRARRWSGCASWASPTGSRPTPADAVEGADCVMLCAPVGAFAEIAAAIAPHLAPGAVADRCRLAPSSR